VGNFDYLLPYRSCQVPAEQLGITLTLVRQRHFVIFGVTGVNGAPPRDHAGLCRRR
jgi:hypothetical protein